MKTLLSTLLVACLSLMSGAALAESNYHYDYETGNSYSSHSDSLGTTTYGNNARTGSNWEIRQNRNGTYDGRDSKGNYFTGDNTTGHYYNFGTGKTCYGKGAARTCY